VTFSPRGLGPSRTGNQRQGGIVVAVPKKKTSQSRRDQRRAHHALKGPKLVGCPNCGQPHVPHRVCANCGYYKGRTVVAIEATE
jgi:large subunit ribosomal protein L32